MQRRDCFLLLKNKESYYFMLSYAIFLLYNRAILSPKPFVSLLRQRNRGVMADAATGSGKENDFVTFHRVHFVFS